MNIDELATVITKHLGVDGWSLRTEYNADKGVIWYLENRYTLVHQDEVIASGTSLEEVIIKGAEFFEKESL
jgi:hypothetical protein